MKPSLTLLLLSIFTFSHKTILANSEDPIEEETTSFLEGIDYTNETSFYSAYRFKKNSFRHTRFEGRNKLKGDLIEDLKFSTDVRARFDYSVLAKENKFNKAVRKDESLEFDVLEAIIYADLDIILCDVGIQQIDWTNSLSPNTVDILTPIDIRNGGWGSPNEIIVPVPAIKTYFTKINLEWLIIPFPESNRIPQGPNEYGFYENLTKSFGNQIAIKEEKIPATMDHIETGLRIKQSFDKVDTNFIFFKSHRRNPSSFLKVTNNSIVETLTLKYPKQNVFGLGLTYAGDKESLRVYSYYDPNRFSNVQIENLEANTFSQNITPQKENRLNIGLGLDYIFSENLKLYSDSIYTTVKLIKEEETLPLYQGLNKDEDTFQSSIQMEYKSFYDIYFALKSTFLFPYFAYALTPEVSYTYENWKANLGAHLITTKNEKSKFEPFKDNNQVYSKISLYF